jgi:hypothetical protein
MSSIKITLEVVEDLRQLAGILESLVRAMETSSVAPAGIEGPKEEPITIEKVRAVLSEKSQSGKQPQVKVLIIKYGANKLTDINPACYPQLLAEAKAL